MPSTDTQFKPGQSGNPDGRPKSKPFKAALEKAIAELGLEAAALALVVKANTGDVPALNMLADRLDGKVPQAIIGDDDEPPIQTVTRIEIVAPDVNRKG